MKLDNIVYDFNYHNKNINCVISNIIKNNNVIECFIGGKGSMYYVYLISSNYERWLGIPEMNVSTSLSTLDDIYWNSEKIGQVLNNVVDGLIIAEGLKNLNAV